MNAVRERILLDVNSSLRNYSWNEHRDLASFCVCSEYFGDWEETEGGYSADFSEVIAIVDKDWLYEYMNMENPLKYLQEEYTSDDSIDWFDEANRTGHLAMISFN